MENKLKLIKSSHSDIDYVLSLNNSKFADYVDRIYPIELEIKDTKDTARSGSYPDLLYT